MPPHIVIDYSAYRHENVNGSPDLEKLLESVRALSVTSRVHVYVRSKLSGMTPRRYQALLQSFGCTVTARSCC